MENTIHSKNRIGVLGGGQLARFLATESYKSNFKINVLSSSKKDPAAQVTPNHFIGSLNQKKDLLKFCKKNNIVTFESEFIETDLLKDIPGVKFYPSLKNIKTLQDRFTQKKLLTKFKIPTSNYTYIKNYTDALKAFDEASATTIVFKTCRDGYDGYGTLIANSKKDILARKSFFKKTCIAEEFIPFKKELALTFCRNTKGKIVSFPLVQSFQKDHKCLWVKGPIRKNLYSLEKKIINLLNSINYVGTITFELFDCGKKILVNEVAPRVHNTAHHTLDSTNISQFEAHILAIQGFDLPKIQMVSKGFSMLNLIGTGKAKSNIQNSCGKLYWYGKDENRKGRKMAHVNFLANSPGLALDMALKYLKRVKL